MQRQIEILAPAGSYESMKAAMNAGCDAVYIGGSSFGARAYADNPDENTLLEAIDEAHIRKKKLYLTVNTLIKEKEMKSGLCDFLEKYYLAGLDAVIVQDVGVMHFIHRYFPGLPIHASTQTTLTMAQGANLLKDMGVTRLVTARELSFEEIKDIRGNTDLEIETFVHGALCYCYSGQCLMSSFIGGRSGNRGRCAQPCRMTYRFNSGEKTVSSDREPYLLSLKDINTVALIPDLIEAGVDSFKIEGRMKRSEYAAGVTYIYRKYVDLYLSQGRERFNEFLKSREYEKDMRDLSDLYNRGGFSNGYGSIHNGKSMMSMVRPNHSGVPVGKVAAFENGYAKILLSEEVNAQDVLEIRNNESDPVFEFTVKESTPVNNILTVRAGLTARKDREKTGQILIHKGYPVYRTKNNMLLDSIRERFINNDAKQGIAGFLYAKAGEKLRLDLKFDNHNVTVYHNMVEAAKNQPMTADKLKASIDKLGNTLFYFKELNVEADDNIFVPVAWLNEIRRQAIKMLTESITGAFRRNKAACDSLAEKDVSYEEISHKENSHKEIPYEKINIQKNPDKEDEAAICYSKTDGDDIDDADLYNISRKISPGSLYVSAAVQTEEQFHTVLSYPEVNAVYADYDTFSLKQITMMGDSASVAGKALYVLLPHICRKAVYEKLKKDIPILIKNDKTEGFIVKNFEEAQLVQSIFMDLGLRKKIRLNHNMYIFNKEAKLFWQEKGIYDFTAPLELNEKELKDLGLSDCELMVYGFMPVMVSAQCLYANTRGCKKCKPGANGTDYLSDRIGKKFYVRSYCNSCYNIIYNGQRLSLIGQTEKIANLKPCGIRLDFTFENAEETDRVLSAYIDAFLYGREASLEFDNITTGHFKRGVE